MKHSPSSLTLLSALIIQSALAIPCPPAGNSSSLAPLYPTGNNFSSTISPSAYATLSSTFLPYENPVLSAISFTTSFDFPSSGSATAVTNTPAPWEASSASTLAPVIYSSTDAPLPTSLERRDDWWARDSPVASPWAPETPVASPWAPRTPVASPWRTFGTPSPDTRDAWQSPAPWALSPRAPEPQLGAMATAIAPANDYPQEVDYPQDMARVESIAAMRAAEAIQRRATRFAPGSEVQATASTWETPVPQSAESQASASSWETQAPQPSDETYGYDAATDPAPSAYLEPEQNRGQQFGKREPLRLASENGTQYNQANYTKGSGNGQVNSTVNGMLSQRSPQLNETWVPAPQYTSTLEAQQAGVDPQTQPEPIMVAEPVFSSEDDGTPSFDRRKRSPIAQDSPLPSALISAMTSLSDSQPVTPTIDQPTAEQPAPEQPAPQPPAPQPPAPQPLTPQPPAPQPLTPQPPAPQPLTPQPPALQPPAPAQPESPVVTSNGIEPNVAASLDTAPPSNDQYGSLSTGPSAGLGRRSAEPQDSADYTTHEYWTESMNSDPAGELEQYDRPGVEWFQKRSPSPQDAGTALQNIWDTLQSESGSGLQAASATPPSDGPGNAGTFRKRSADPEPQTSWGSDTGGYTGSTSGYGNTTPSSSTGTSGDYGTTAGTAPGSSQGWAGGFRKRSADPEPQTYSGSVTGGYTGSTSGYGNTTPSSSTGTTGDYGTTAGTGPGSSQGWASGSSQGTTVGVAGRIKFRRRAA